MPSDDAREPTEQKRSRWNNKLEIPEDQEPRERENYDAYKMCGCCILMKARQPTEEITDSRQ